MQICSAEIHPKRPYHNWQKSWHKSAKSEDEFNVLLFVAMVWWVVWYETFLVSQKHPHFIGNNWTWTTEILTTSDQVQVHLTPDTQCISPISIYITTKLVEFQDPINKPLEHTPRWSWREPSLMTGWGMLQGFVGKVLDRYTVPLSLWETSSGSMVAYFESHNTSLNYLK